jgi:hypothetical protein
MIMRHMGPRRTLIGMEFATSEDVRLRLDSDGWAILTPRSLGPAVLERARALLERCEACYPPIDPDRLEPVSMEEIGLHVAKTMAMRVTHRRFKKR